MIFIEEYLVSAQWRHAPYELVDRLSMSAAASRDAILQMAAAWRDPENPKLRLSSPQLFLYDDAAEKEPERFCFTTDAEMRRLIVEQAFKTQQLSRISVSCFTSDANVHRAVISPTSPKPSGDYYFGWYDRDVAFLRGAKYGYKVIGCKDTGAYFVLPPTLLAFLASRIDQQPLIEGHRKGRSETTTPHYNFYLFPLGSKFYLRGDGHPTMLDVTSYRRRLF
jgi:hypothetical protein